jgi:gamma-glutamyltranspeptidase/glutathione hydrolase
MLPAGVAAGHPATVDAGLEILQDGGSAADAAVAAALASCVAETVMSGLLGGLHAIYWDGRSARNLDGFVAVPLEPGGELIRLAVPFGEELVHYAIGPASCAVPGLPAALAALWQEHGRLPWARVVEPALRLAHQGVRMPPAHVACLQMLEPVMTMNRGAELYAPGGALLGVGDFLHQPGLVSALEALAGEGAESVYHGAISDALLAVDGVRLTREDLRRYRARWAAPVEVEYAGTRVLTRAGLTGMPEAVSRLPPLGELSPTERVLALLDALDGSGPETHTTNLVAVDGDGHACVLTHSLGLGSGDFLPGFDLHLNSMLGEVDLLQGPLEPGGRMESMMAPTLALDAAGPAIAIGAAGGTRLRTALVTVLAGVLAQGLAPDQAVALPRVHRAGNAVHAEPGVDEQALRRLEELGHVVRRWSAQHHYFGGVSLVARAGAAGDPRRSGHAATLR